MNKLEGIGRNRRFGIGQRLVSNSKWNLLAFSANVAANFLTIPYVIFRIGLTAFGEAGLVLSMLAPFMLIGTVLGQATVRELSPSFTRQDHEGANRIFSTSVAICALAAAVVATLFLLFGGLILHRLAGQDSAELEGNGALLIAALGWAAQQLTLVIQGAVAATQRYQSLARISILASLTNALAIVLGATFYPTAIGYLSGTAIGFVVALLVWGFLARQSLPWLFPLSRATGDELRRIIHFGKWQSAAHLAGAFGNQMDRYVLGALAPLAVVGQYNVAMRLQEVAYMGVLKAGEVLFPHFSVTADDPVERRADFFIAASWVLNTIAACLLAPLIPLSEWLISLWINPQAAEGAAPMLRMLAAAGIIGSAVNVYFYHSMGTGQNSRLAGLNMINAIITIGATIVLIGWYGPRAAGSGILLAGLIQLGLVILLSQRSFAIIARSRLIHCTLSPLLSGLVIASIWFYSRIVSPSNWGSLAFVFLLISVSVLFGAVILTAMTRDGRAVLGRVFRIARPGFLGNS